MMRRIGPLSHFSFQPEAIAWLAVCLAGIVIPLWQGLAIVPTRHFDADEFQHLHSAWCLTQGLVLYRDYFEHHAPLLYFLLAPLLAVLRPEDSGSAALRTIIIARSISYAFTVGIFAVLALTAARRQSAGRRAAAGITAVAFLSSLPMFWWKGIEVRPDVPALFFFLVSMLLLQTGLFGSSPAAAAAQEAGRSRRLLILAAGAAVMAALLFTQKLVFLGAGLLLFWCWYLFDSRAGAARAEKIDAAAYFGLGALIPLSIVLLWFWQKDALRHFFWFNINFNLQWHSSFSALPSLADLLARNPCLALAGILGLLLRLISGSRPPGRRRGDLLFVLPALSGLCGAFIIQEAYWQYYLPLLALFSLLATEFCIEAGAGLIGLVTAGRGADRFCRIVLPIALLWIVVVQGPEIKQPGDNAKQIDFLNWVMEHSAAGDTVFDDWPIYAAFRPHSWYYWSHQYQMVPMIPEEEKKLYLKSLRAAENRPRLIALSNFFKTLFPEAEAALSSSYSRGKGPYWIRSD